MGGPQRREAAACCARSFLSSPNLYATTTRSRGHRSNRRSKQVRRGMSRQAGSDALLLLPLLPRKDAAAPAASFPPRTNTERRECRRDCGLSVEPTQKPPAVASSEIRSRFANWRRHLPGDGCAAHGGTAPGAAAAARAGREKNAVVPLLKGPLSQNPPAMGEEKEGARPPQCCNRRSSGRRPLAVPADSPASATRRPRGPQPPERKDLLSPRRRRRAPRNRARPPRPGWGRVGAPVWPRRARLR